MSRRRSPGEGSVFHRKSDARWQANLTLPDGARKAFYGATKREAREKLDAAKADLLRGLPVRADERMTVGRYLPEWLDAHGMEIRPGTSIYYGKLIRLHLLPRLGGVRLAQLAPTTIQRLYADLIADKAAGGAGLSPSSVAVIHQILHAALRRAAEHGLLARNVADLVRPPRRVPPDIRPLSREQARALLEEARGERLEAIFVLALATGMRIGELLSLRWGDVDLERRHLSVRRTLSWLPAALPTPRGVSTPTFGEPKTKRSRRRILLGLVGDDGKPIEPAVDALRAHRARQAAERLRAGAAWGAQWHEGELVFCSEVGEPLRGEHVRRIYRRLLRACGLPAVRFHDLRHTCATLLLLANINPKVVSELLGHSSVAMTLDVYSHVLPDMQEDAAAVLAAALGS